MLRNTHSLTWWTGQPGAKGVVGGAHHSILRVRALLASWAGCDSQLGFGRGSCPKSGPALAPLTVADSESTYLPQVGRPALALSPEPGLVLRPVGLVMELSGWGPCGQFSL